MRFSERCKCTRGGRNLIREESNRKPCQRRASKELPRPPQATLDALSILKLMQRSVVIPEKPIPRKITALTFKYPEDVKQTRNAQPAVTALLFNSRKRARSTLSSIGDSEHGSVSQPGVSVSPVVRRHWRGAPCSNDYIKDRHKGLSKVGATHISLEH